LSAENVDLQTNALKFINAILSINPNETERRHKVLAALGIDKVVNSKYVRFVCNSN
jgi:hypothetical protein